MLKVRFLVRWGQLASGEGLADKCSQRVNMVGKGFARSMAAAECLARIKATRAEMKVTPLPLVYSLLATESAESSNRAGTAPAAERCSRAGGAKQSGFRGGCGQGGGRRAGWSWRLTPLFAQPSLAVPALRGEGVPCQRGPLLPRTPKDARAGGAAPSRVRGRRAVRQHPVHGLVTDYIFVNVLNCHDTLMLARERANASCDYKVALPVITKSFLAVDLWQVAC